jgi:hypothetical protein
MFITLKSAPILQAPDTDIALPMRIELRMLNEEPIAQKPSTDILLPMETVERIDILLPSEA